jgi:RNA polymerase sigma-70 factor (ECF subfamily)
VQGDLPEWLDDVPTPSGKQHARVQIQRALQKLPEAQRDIILLHWFEGMSFSDIEEALEMNENTVRVYAHRAMNSMRSFLGEDVGNVLPLPNVSLSKSKS